MIRRVAQTAPGFRLVRLEMTGRRVPHAALDFKPGLNVITGASDTGKSYLVECIDFMLGARQAPRDIPESRLYERIRVKLAAGDREFVLERALRGGAFLLLEGNSSKTLAPKHDPGRDDNISVFLLDLAGLQGNKIQVNQQGKTRPISFRDIAKLVIIDEERIITKESPVLSGQYTSRTSEGSVFQLLLTGRDASALIEVESPKERAIRAKAQGALLDELSKDLIRQLHESASVDVADLDIEIARVDQEVAALMPTIADAQREMAEAETRRRDAWQLVRKSESRRTYLDQMLARFELLERYYRTDSERLALIAQADYALGQLRTEMCPLCGGILPDEHVAAEDGALAAACAAEAEKINGLLADLSTTVAQVTTERRQVDADAKLARESLTSVDRHVAEVLRPRALRLSESVENLLSSKVRLEYTKFLRSQLARLEERRNPPATVDAGPDEDSEPVRKGAATREADGFCRVVEEMLRSWRFPGLDRVTFSETAQDLVISGKDRGAHGKGFRAIAYSAFVIGLLRYCRINNIPHPGIIVLDSPLVTYRKADVPTGEGIGEDVVQAFYRSLAKAQPGEQVIVFENEDPEVGVQKSINYIHFSGSPDVGRAGFFPGAE